MDCHASVGGGVTGVIDQRRLTGKTQVVSERLYDVQVEVKEGEVKGSAF